MSTSQNGWPAYNNTSHFTRFNAAGRKWWAANADCAVVAAEFIIRWDTEVESVTKDDKELDDWSWADRHVRGSDTQVSNHASATAWDINATQHPRGVALAKTFSTAQISAVHRIRNAITDDAGRPVFRWGGDYVNSPIDGMHIEINATPAQVAQARRKLEDDMEWTDKIKLTAVDARVWGTNPDTGKAYKEGDKVSIGQMLRYPTLARKIDAKLDTFIAEQEQRDAALLAAIQALTTK